MRFLILALMLFYFTPAVLSADYNTDYCSEAYRKGYAQGKKDWYWKGHSVGYKKAQSEYQDNYDKAYKDGYNKGKKDGYDGGYGQGKKDGYDNGYNTGYGKGKKDGYDGGYGQGKKDGYDDGYQTAKDQYDKPDGYGYCAYIFKWNGDIVFSETECSETYDCDDNNRNTVNLCILK